MEERCVTPEPLIGSPQRPVSDWLYQLAADNDEAAREALLPWKSLKYKGQSWAFRTAAEMVRRAHGRQPEPCA